MFCWASVPPGPGPGRVHCFLFLLGLLPLLLPPSPTSASARLVCFHSVFLFFEEGVAIASLVSASAGSLLFLFSSTCLWYVYKQRPPEPSASPSCDSAPFGPSLPAHSPSSYSFASFTSCVLLKRSALLVVFVRDGALLPPGSDLVMFARSVLVFISSCGSAALPSCAPASRLSWRSWSCRSCMLMHGHSLLSRVAYAKEYA